MFGRGLVVLNFGGVDLHLGALLEFHFATLGLHWGCIGLGFVQVH